MKVLLATNVNDLDDALTSENQIHIVGKPVYYREAVTQIAEQTRPDVVVLTAWLDGNMDIIDVVYQLRSLDIRIVFIAGTLTPDDVTIKKILELSVYDILFGEVRIGEVIEKILAPTPPSQGLSLMGNHKPDYHQQIEVNPVGLETDEPESEKEGTISRLKKISGDIKKSIPSVPKLAKTTKYNNVLEKLVAVCSPVQAGKTFTSVNLATVIANEGYTTALVDTDYEKFSIHTWLNCPEGEESLLNALEDNSDPLVHAFQPSYIPNLYVFTHDPGNELPVIKGSNLLSLLKALEDCVDIIMLDTPSNFNAPVTKSAIELASLLLIVNDPDFSHLLRIQKEIDNLPEDFDFEKCLIIANKLVESDKLPPDDAERATGMKVSCMIPSKPLPIFESIKAGIPTVMFDQEVKEAFTRLILRELVQKESA